MSEARKLFERFQSEAREVQTYFSDVGKSDSAYIFGGIVEAIRRALAAQPDADAVPELPEFVECDEDGDYIVHFDNRLGCCLAPHYRAEDYDRIAEAARILAARERARRE